MEKRIWPKIVGNQNNIAFLDTQLKRGNLSSCYLFWGPPQVGKFTTALEFSKNILCDNNNFKLRLHPDFMLVEDQGEEISIMAARELKRGLSYRPVASNYKVVVFENASLLTLEAQNALLKTLEEPPLYAVIVLIAQEENLLPTILSRCQKLYFQPASYLEILEALKEQGREEEEAKFLAHISLGRYGQALQSEQLYQRWQESFESLFQLIFANLKKKMDYVKEGKVPDIAFWTLILRDVFYFQNHSKVVEYYPQGVMSKLKAISEKYAAREIKTILDKMIFTERLLKTNVNKRLALENLMLAL
jgi:DNA polymerase-3 subunit delta'